MVKRFAFLALLLLAGTARAGQDNITQMDVVNIIHAAPLPSTGTVTSTAFRALEKSTHQTVVIQASGASPNYKVELLVTLDRTVFASPLTVAFTKPEVGGTLYTFTDALAHVFPLFGPACLGQELLVTGLGGTQGNIEASELSQ